MKIDYVVPCRGVEHLVDGSCIAFGVETNAHVTSVLPTTLVTYLLICVTQAHNERLTGELRINVLNPSLEPCTYERTLSFALNRPPLMPDGWATRTVVPVRMMFEVSTYGNHSIEVAASGSSWSVPFIVLQPAS